MSAVKDAFHSWLDSDLVVAARNLLEAALFRPNEPQPTSVWKSIISPPMPYWATVFSQACQVISLLILLPILAMAVLDFAGYAVFRTLGKQDAELTSTQTEADNRTCFPSSFASQVCTGKESVCCGSRL